MSLSLAENVIVVGADNFLNGSFQYRTIVEPGNETTPAIVRARTYTDLTDEEKIRKSVNIKATNIVLQGLPQNIYNFINHNEDAKQIWDRVKLLIQCSELTLQEQESKLYDYFDIFTSMLEETIHSYYMRFVQLINDMHMIGMTMKPLQSHYLPQVVTSSPAVHQQQYQAPVLQQAYQALAIQQSFAIELDLGLVVPSFNPFDDPIANLNKLMEFVSTSFGPCFPQINNQLRTSSTLRNQATIQNGRVTVQTIQGRQTHGYANNRARNTATNPSVNRQGALCSKQKRPKNSAWFKENMLLTEALESGAYLDPEQLAFLADNEDTIVPAQASQEIPTPTAFQTDDLDAFDSDCDDVPSAKAVLMANLSSCDSYGLLEVIVDRNAKVTDFEKQIHSLKLQLNATVESHKTLSMTVEYVMNVVMHANVHNVLSMNTNYLDNDNLALASLKMENDCLMKLLISQDLVHTAVNSLATINDYKSMQLSFVDEFNENLVLKTELAKKNDMIDKVVYNKLSKRCSRLENQRILLEIKLQQRKENFQTNRPSHNQDAPKFKEFFIINELQAQLRAKNVSIEKLKEHIMNIKGNNVVESVQNAQNSNVVTSKVYKLDLPPLSSS
ncbi:hypothetical protein Tco_0200487 [Tanacetum coccineum]